METTSATAEAQASQAVQLLDWLSTQHWGQLSSLEGDSATIQSQGILDVCERLLLINSELMQSQAETIERLLPHRNELARQYQTRSYTTASERIIAKVVEVRRWARRLAEHLLGEVSIDLKSHCEKCPWDDSLSQEIKQQLLDERSCCQPEPTTPLVTTNGEAPPKNTTGGGGARRRRRKAGEQRLTSQGLKLVAALCTWHDIKGNGKDVLFDKRKPAIGCREVPREFKGIPFATASEQFKELFGSHKAYSQKWEKNPVGLAYQLATLNGEVFCLGSDIPESEDDTEG